MRDRLVVRLRELDMQRARFSSDLTNGAEDEATVAAERCPSRRATPSLAAPVSAGLAPREVRWACWHNWKMTAAPWRTP